MRVFWNKTKCSVHAENSFINYYKKFNFVILSGDKQLWAKQRVGCQLLAKGMFDTFIQVCRQLTNRRTRSEGQMLVKEADWCRIMVNIHLLNIWTEQFTDSLEKRSKGVLIAILNVTPNRLKSDDWQVDCRPFEEMVRTPSDPRQVHVSLKLVIHLPKNSTGLFTDCLVWRSGDNIKIIPILIYVDIKWNEHCHEIWAWA